MFPETVHSAWWGQKDGHLIGVSVAGGRMGFRCFSKSCCISFKALSWNSNSSIRLSRSRICLWRDCILPDITAAGSLFCSSEAPGAVPHALRATATITVPPRLPQIFVHKRFMLYVCHQAPHPARTFRILAEPGKTASANVPRGAAGFLVHVFHVVYLARLVSSVCLLGLPHKSNKTNQTHEI